MERWAPIALVLLAAALRLYRLGLESLWFDEGWSALIARESWPKLRSILLTQPFPFYYALLNLWSHLGDNEFMLRLISAIAGTASVATLYVATVETLGCSRARLAALLLAISPLHIWYSQEARMYALGGLLSLAATWVLLGALRKPGWVRWVAYTLLSTVALYTFYYTAFIIVCHGVYMAFLAWQERGARQGPSGDASATPGRGRTNWYLSSPALWLVSTASALLLSLPGLLVLAHQMSGGTWVWLADKYGRPGVGDLVSTAIAFSLGDFWAGPQILRWIGLAVFVGAFLAGIGQLSVARDRLAYALRLDSGKLLWLLYLCLPIGAVFLASQLTPAYLTRYLIVFLPAYCAVVGKGVSDLRPRALSAISFFLILLTTAIALGTLYNSPQKEDWRSISQVIRQGAQPRDAILLVDEDASAVLDYYLRDALPVRGVDGAIQDQAELADIVDQVGRYAGRIWLVQSHTANRALYQSMTQSSMLRLGQEWSAIGIELALFDRVR